jgi:hypothetical protein
MPRRNAKGVRWNEKNIDRWENHRQDEEMRRAEGSCVMADQKSQTG